MGKTFKNKKLIVDHYRGAKGQTQSVIKEARYKARVPLGWGISRVSRESLKLYRIVRRMKSNGMPSESARKRLVNGHGLSNLIANKLVDQIYFKK